MKFKFRSKSSMSFPVVHKGRKQFINFTSMGNGTSLFITEDDGLAKKIRAHKWFREGRIQEEQVASVEAKADEPLHIPDNEQPAPYSILNRGMSSTPYKAPTMSEVASSGWKTDGPDSYGMGTKRVDSDASEVDISDAETTTSEDPDATTDSSLQIPAETVSSLTEAKEFFSVNYGIDRSLIRSKEAVAKLCAQYNVEFENYLLS